MRRNHLFHHRAVLMSAMLSISMLLSVITCGTAHAGVRSSGVSNVNQAAASEQTTVMSHMSYESTQGGVEMNPYHNETSATSQTTAATPFAQHGRLQVRGIELVDQSGAPFQLKGVSTHGLQWFPQYVSQESFASLQSWGANAVRLAMYTGEGGYVSGGDRAQLEATIDRSVQAAAALGMYVIIDWHILSDGNPNQHTGEAVDFFSRMAAKYAGLGNVLYEICNEPNGGVQWPEIKNYADQVIPAIRQYDPTGIIIVGTPNWSQDVEQVASAPLAQPGNVMYALHFYAGTHKDNIRQKLVTARAQGTPVIISEFSICDASGNGGIDYASAEAWNQLICETGVSYFAWSLSNKAETSALISSSCSRTSGWSDAELSETGRWLKTMLAAMPNES